jgi:Protein of unknown function (DUF3443)
VNDFIRWSLLLVLILVAGCNGSTSSSTPTATPAPAPTPVPTPADANFLSMEVNSQPYGYANIPTASVTICQPGTSNCQTINGVLIDTGSVGLRIFSSALAVPLQQQEVNGEPIGQCEVFIAGPTWGPIGLADLQMGNEPKISSMPVQIIADSNFAPEPADCANRSVQPAQTDPAVVGFNGILGVGPLPQDCGNFCASVPTNAYYSCTSASPSGTCTPTVQALGDQVPNPVALLPVDNNGVVVELPQLPSSGTPSASGFLLFGIGTESDNQLGSATVLTLNSSLSINVTYKGASLPDSFIDSGSQAFFFQDSSIHTCPNSSTYCPSSPLKLSAVATGQNGNSSKINFEIATPLSPNFAFNDLGANNDSSDEFDLGLSFFFGRSVFVAIQGAGTPAGPGPYWAF